MSNVQIVKAYPKDGNAVFKLISVNENPLNPIRTCYVTKPIGSVEGNLSDYNGKTFPGRIVFDESVNPNPKTTFNLAKRAGVDQITYYLVFKENGLVGYLERHWRYTKSERSDFKIDREVFEIRPVTKSPREWKRVLEGRMV